ncbi:MAG: type II toxin-antitoxin system HigB family toxin [Pseudomonadota bacterium]|nr:type II toxin-antitoxin system HigB family toxin [Pseudomonadota bacterium]
MHVIAKRTLRAFWARYPDAEEPLTRWHTTLEKASPKDFAELKTSFGSADWVSGYVVFDIGGNKYRLVADIVFRSQTVFVKHVMTHAEYNRWEP